MLTHSYLRFSSGKAKEVTRSNLIMGDMTETLAKLLKPGGLDHTLLTEIEKRNNDFSRLTFSDREKKILRHFEGASLPAQKLCKFLQDKNPNAWAYVTFELARAIQTTSAPTIAIHPDVSHMARTKDLRDRGDKTVLLRKSGVDVSEDEAKNYSSVEDMEPLVEQYCELYTEDLARRVGMEAKFLSPAFTKQVLLNPMFGFESYVVGSGLLSARQYTRARTGK